MKWAIRIAATLAALVLMTVGSELRRQPDTAALGFALQVIVGPGIAFVVWGMWERTRIGGEESPPRRDEPARAADT